MDPKDIKAWIDVAQGVITIAATLLAGLWAWIRFVLERGLMPASQMDISVSLLGRSATATIMEVEVQIGNKGSSALVVTDLRIRLRYADQDDAIRLIDQPGESAYGHVAFPHAGVLDGIGAKKREVKGKLRDEVVQLGSGEFLVVPYDTFVQPGVDQMYSFVTALPPTAAYLLARASFRYQLRPSDAQLEILGIGRELGIIQYSLKHVKEPHTVEKSFAVGLGMQSLPLNE
jgi:hypothetical protein